MADAFVKAPGDRVTLVHDFTRELQGGEIIVTVDSYAITPAGVTIHGTPDHDTAGLKVEGEISGGVEDVIYTVTIQVTTDSPGPHILTRVWPLHLRGL